MNESKINATIDYARVSEENLHCITDTVYQPPGQRIWCGAQLRCQNSIRGGVPEISSNHSESKKVVTYELKMELENVRSLEEVTRFLQVELQNPSAKLVDHRQGDIREPCEPSGAWFNYQKLFPCSLKSCKEREESVVFESEIPFSNETKQLVSDACSTECWKEKNGRFSLSKGGKGYTEPETSFALLRPGDGLFISDRYCSIRTSIKV